MKLRMDVIKVTRGLMADPRKLSRVIENALSAAALGAKADFGVTAQTWSKESKPRFSILRKTGERIVYTGSKIYKFVDGGTKPHNIVAKGKKPLKFKSGYRAKTSPGKIGSGSGGTSGSWVSKRMIKHPGTKPRKFSETIAKKWRKELPEIMQRSIDSEL
jgi:hypothetical protein